MITQVTQFTYVYDGLVKGKQVIGSDIIQSYFIQALLWSLGAGLMEDDRKMFEDYLRSLSTLPEVETEEEPIGASNNYLLSHLFIYNYSNLFLPSNHLIIHTSVHLPTLSS